jgi:hypothetical protein
VAGPGAGPTLVTIVGGLVGFGLPSSFSEAYATRRRPAMKPSSQSRRAFPNIRGTLAYLHAHPLAIGAASHEFWSSIPSSERRVKACGADGSGRI